MTCRQENPTSTSIVVYLLNCVFCHLVNVPTLAVKEQRTAVGKREQAPECGPGRHRLFYPEDGVWVDFVNGPANVTGYAASVWPGWQPGVIGQNRGDPFGRGEDILATILERSESRDETRLLDKAPDRR
jgi:hypothetical protein